MPVGNLKLILPESFLWWFFFNMQNSYLFAWEKPMCSPVQNWLKSKSEETLHTVPWELFIKLYLLNFSYVWWPGFCACKSCTISSATVFIYFCSLLVFIFSATCFHYRTSLSALSSGVAGAWDRPQLASPECLCNTFPSLPLESPFGCRFWSSSLLF